MDSGCHLRVRSKSQCLPAPNFPTPEVLLRGWKEIMRQSQGQGGPETQAALLQISWNLNLTKLCTWAACSQHKFQRSLLPFPEEPFPCTPPPAPLQPGLFVVLGCLSELGPLNPRPRQVGPGEGTALSRLDGWRVLHIHPPSLPWAKFQVLGEGGAGLQPQGILGKVLSAKFRVVV